VASYGVNIFALTTLSLYEWLYYCYLSDVYHININMDDVHSMKSDRHKRNVHINLYYTVGKHKFVCECVCVRVQGQSWTQCIGMIVQTAIPIRSP
jgi:hypothetical protein